MFEVVYYSPTRRTWLFAARFDDRADADVKTDELRVAGYDARVIEASDAPELDHP
jgi:hypothetical protein